MVKFASVRFRVDTKRTPLQLELEFRGLLRGRRAWKAAPWSLVSSSSVSVLYSAFGLSAQAATEGQQAKKAGGQVQTTFATLIRQVSAFHRELF
jgi:hypothetical protein